MTEPFVRPRGVDTERIGKQRRSSRTTQEHPIVLIVEPPPTAQDPSSPDLGGLIIATARGDRTAFAALFDLLAPDVFGLVSHLTSDTARAERVLHEVFLDAWRHAPRLADIGISPGEWMLSNARLRCEVSAT